MTDLIGEVITEAEGAIDALVHDAEEVFPPRPGGWVDTHRKRRAAEEAAREEGATSTVQETGRNKVKAVRTITEAPNLARTSCVLLTPTAQVRRLLPRDSARRSAVILAVDNDVYITHDQGVAWNVQGTTTGTGAFYLPAGIAIPIDSQGELYAAITTTGTSSRVSVLVNRDSE